MADASSKFNSILNNPKVKEKLFPEGLTPAESAKIAAMVMHGCLVWEGIRNSLDECEVDYKEPPKKP